MERLQRALERAKAERDLVTGGAPARLVEAPAPSPSLSPSPSPASNGAMPDGDDGVAAAPAAEPAIGRDGTRFMDTQQVRITRSQPVDLRGMREAGLLLPGMVGTAAHSFKMLRTQVMQRMRPRKWNTLAVVSPAPDEGKTFVAINLAVAIAADPNSTALLVDLDLRAPRVHRRFGITPQVGVEDCLRGEATPAQALVAPEGYDSLLLLPARGPVEQSSELLASTRTRQLVREIKERYTNRVVIYDLPPVLGSDDALAFAPQVDALLVVVGDERTKREELQRCLELVREIPIVGTVLNGSRREQSAAYAY
jgi:protein-tyrosine kinase